jgi:hypothetical protein
MTASVPPRRPPGGTDASHNFLLGGYCAWLIENELHWVLDMAFDEDSNRTAAGHAGANLGLIRRVAASLLQQDPGRGSIKAKRLSAALDESYMLRAYYGDLPQIRCVGPASLPVWL